MFRSVAIGFVVILSTVLSGCISPQVVQKDGKDYINGWPLLATGVLEGIRITNNDGTSETISAASGAVVDLTSDMAITTQIGNATGLSGAGGGLILGSVNVLMGILSNYTAPQIDYLVRREPEGDVINVPTEQGYIKHTEELFCVTIGDRVNVVQRRGFNRGFDIFNANPEMMRSNFLSESCESRRKRFSEAEKAALPSDSAVQDSKAGVTEQDTVKTETKEPVTN